MNTLDEIQQAIRRLSRREREELAEWILNSEDFGDRIEEPQAAYRIAVEHRFLTVEEYLNLDPEEGVSYEYIAGEIFAMSNPKVRHEIIAMNLAGAFHSHLKGGPGRTFAAKGKVHLKVSENDIFYQPDVMVSCGPFNDMSLEMQYVENPRLVVEVLSRSTESIDRREKALNYRHIPTLDDYVLVAQRKIEVTIYRRSENWVPSVLREREAVAEFRSIGLELPLDRIYEGAR